MALLRAQPHLRGEDGNCLQGALLLLHLLLQLVNQVLLEGQRSLGLLQAAAQVPPLPPHAPKVRKQSKVLE